MNKLSRQVVTGLTTGALLLSTFTQVALADTNLTITGNARGTDNTATVNANNSTTAVQSNTAVVTNTVNNNTNTGGNHANDNVGLNGTGSVSISTGDTAQNTTINNALNSNQASLANCGCNNGSTNVAVTGNGRNSDNTATVNNNNSVSAFQNNSAVVANQVNNNSNTGNNHASDNLGGNGGVSISTGSSLSNTTINTLANANVLQIGAGVGASAGSTNLLIGSNLKNSDNTITVNNDHAVLAEQDNNAVVTNSVNNNANSGKNFADDNLGTVAIATGALGAATTINNAVNFNAAAVDCGCMTTVNAKIAGNGRNSDNDLTANLGNETQIFQGGREGNGNLAVLDNAVNGNLNSGKNGASDNVGGLLGDPSISTGLGWSATTVNNAGNVNTIGPVASFTLPTGSSLNMSFDMNGLLGMWGWLM